MNRKYGPALSLPLLSVDLKATFEEGHIRDLLANAKTPSGFLGISGEIRRVFNRPELNLDVTGAAGLEGIQTLLHLDHDLSGQATLKATIRGHLDDPRIHAELNCHKPVVGPVVMDALSCSLDGSGQAVTIDGRAAVPGAGEVTATGDLILTGVFPEGITGAEHDFDQLAYDVRINATGVDINQLLDISHRMKGVVGSDIRITGRGIYPDRLTADISGKMGISDFTQGNLKTAEPLVIEMNGRCQEGTARLDRLSAKTAGVRMTGNGRYAFETKDVSARFSVTAAEISDLATLAGYNGLRGSLEMEADVSGIFPGVTAAAIVKSRGLAVAPVTIGDVEGRLTLSRGSLTVDHLDIRRGNSHCRAKGAIRLVDEQTGSLSADPAVTLTMAGSGIRLEDVLPDRLKGEAAFSGKIGGTIKKPVGEISLEAANPDIGVARADRLKVSAALTGDVVDIRSFDARFPEGESIQGSGVLSLGKQAYQFEATSEGFSLDRVRPLHDFGYVDGVANFSISGKGVRGEAPALNGNMHLRRLVIAGKSMNDMTSDIQFDNHLVDVAVHGDGTSLSGTLNLTDMAFSARCGAEQADLAPWLAMIGRPDLAGTLTGRMEAAGILTDIPAMKASAEIDRMALSWQERDWCRAESFRLDWHDGVIQFPGIKLTVADEGTVTISGWLGMDRTVSLEINGSAPFSMAEMIVPDLQDMTGRLLLDARVTGTLDRPGVTGALKLSNLGLTLPDMSGKLHDISGIVRFQQADITIEEITGLLGTGRFRLSGTASLDGYLPAAMDVRLTAEAVPVIVPDKMELTLDANLALIRDAGQAVVRGEVVLVDGVYFQDAELVGQTDIIRSPFVKKKEPLPDTASRLPSFLKGLSLDLKLKYRLPLTVDNNIGLLEIQPDLTVKGSLDQPVILGEARIDSGEVLFQRTPFAVEKGAIIFTNPYKTEPRIDLTASTAIRQWKIYLKATGTPEQLEIELTSDPHEEQGDILSLLVFGRPTRDMTAGAGDSENQAETLATFLAGAMSGDIRKMTGLDIVEVSTAENPDEEEEEVEEGTNGQSRITVGSKISDRLTLKYSVESGQNGLVQENATDYRLTETTTVSGFQNNRGVFGGKLIFRYEFR
jgi:autotransporter translocation and assembly factor TamB